MTSSKFIFLIFLGIVLVSSSSYASIRCLDVLSKKKTMNSKFESSDPYEILDAIKYFLQIPDVSPGQWASIVTLNGQGDYKVSVFDQAQLMDVKKSPTSKGSVIISFGKTAPAKNGRVDHYLDITSVSLWNVIHGNLLTTQSRINNPYGPNEITKPSGFAEQSMNPSLPAELINETRDFSIHYNIRRVSENEIQIEQTWKSLSKTSPSSSTDMSDRYSLRLNFRKDAAGKISQLLVKKSQVFFNTQRIVEEVEIKFD
jgi:hypothetical protein